MRSARTISNSNIYHVMLRGINRQNIFEEDEDRFCFMTLLKKYKEISDFRLHAFVLMPNHVHLLIEPAGEPLETVFKRISTTYAGWYNRKYGRTGHLFQDRFRSENVEDDLYFTTVLRYIIQNPMKAGLESRPGSYRWSSYLAYAKGQGAVTDTQYALGFFGSRDELVEYLSHGNDDDVMDEANFDRRLREDKAKEKMFRITQCSSVADFQLLDSSRQRGFAKKMYQEGLSLGQISRMTGMPKTTVFKAVKSSPDFPGEPELSLHEDSLIYYSDAGIVW